MGGSRVERFLAHLDGVSGGLEPRFTRVSSTKPGLRGVTFDAFVVFAPAVLGRDDLVGIDVGDALPVSIQGMYPIHQSERAYVHEHGLDAFWSQDWDPYDVTRRPAV